MQFEDDEAGKAEQFGAKVEPGEYDAVCYKTEIGYSFGNRRDCYIGFRIHGGQHDGVELFMVCAYPKGRLSMRTKFHQQWMLAMQRPPRKGERLSPKLFKNRMFRVLVRDTRRKFAGTNRLMPAFMQYSVVDTILEALTGVPSHD